MSLPAQAPVPVQPSANEIIQDLGRQLAQDRPRDVLQYCYDYFSGQLAAQRRILVDGERSMPPPSTPFAPRFQLDPFSARPVRGQAAGAGAAGAQATEETGAWKWEGWLRQNEAQQQQQQQQQQQPPPRQSPEELPSNFKAGRRQSISAESMVPSRSLRARDIVAAREETAQVEEDEGEDDDDDYETRDAGQGETEGRGADVPSDLATHKTDEQIRRITASIQSNFLFRHLDEEQLRTVMEAMREVVVDEPGTVVIRQGDEGDYFYVVERGEFNVYRKEEDGGQAATSAVDDDLGPLVGHVVAGGSFGELALMYNAPRAASITSTQPGCLLWSLDRQQFRRILMDTMVRRRSLYESLLSSVPVLSTLQSYERQKIADALETQTIEHGTVVIRQNDDGDRFYIIEDGEAHVYKEGHGIVARLGKGSYFGELALICNAPRNATVVAEGKLKVATLDKHAFRRLLGNVMDIMSRRFA